MEKKTKTMNKLLPQEIIEEILLTGGLPVKSLFRFKSVCKSWYAYITSPFFVTNRRKNPTPKFICTDDRSTMYLLDCDNPQEITKIKLPEFEDSTCVKIWGSCNGILLLETFNRNPSTPSTLHLWNPSTREYKQLWHCASSEFRRMFTNGPFATASLKRLVYGFCCNADVNNCEIIKIEKLTSRLGFEIPQKFWVHSSLVYNPRETYKCVGEYLILSRGMGELVDGSLHWIGKRRRVPGLIIVAFNTIDKTFGEVPSPDYEVRGTELYMEVGELEGCLCLLCESKESFEIWVMRRYGDRDSWMKEFQIVGNDVFMRKVLPWCFGMKCVELIRNKSFLQRFLLKIGIPLEWRKFCYEDTTRATYIETMDPLPRNSDGCKRTCF